MSGNTEDRLRAALEYIHDWAALGGEHGEQPDARIWQFAAAVLDGGDPDELARCDCGCGGAS